jgi:hypothetical protein
MKTTLLFKSSKVLEKNRMPIKGTLEPYCLRVSSKVLEINGKNHTRFWKLMGRTIPGSGN